MTKIELPIEVDMSRFTHDLRHSECPCCGGTEWICWTEGDMSVEIVGDAGYFSALHDTAMMPVEHFSGLGSDVVVAIGPNDLSNLDDDGAIDECATCGAVFSAYAPLDDE